MSHAGDERGSCVINRCAFSLGIGEVADDTSRKKNLSGVPDKRLNWGFPGIIDYYGQSRGVNASCHSDSCFIFVRTLQVENLEVLYTDRKRGFNRLRENSICKILMGSILVK